MIERIVKKRIIELMGNFPAIAIVGPRQVGKTTLAKMLMENIKSEAIYIDLESPSDAARLENAELYFRANQDKCIIIDEVQRKPELFPILRSAIDAHRVPTRFILLGSASPHVLMLSSESLAGRIVYVELSALLFAEIGACDTKSHLIRGGFPEPFLMKSDMIREEWFRSFIRTYIERDLPMLGLKTNPDRLQRFLMMLAHCSGELLNKAMIAKSLELSVPTIETYLTYFENAFLVRRVAPYFHNIRKRLVKAPKIYVRDSGIVNHLLGIKNYNDFLGNPKSGALWEGYVIEQIINTLGDAYQYFFYRTQHGAECDLVICQNLTPLALVEIKFTSAPKRTRSLTIACDDIQAKHNFIVIPECIDVYPLDAKCMVCNFQHVVETVQNKFGLENKGNAI